MDLDLRYLPEFDDLILVAILPTPRDLEIARLLGWYRIPLQHAPKILTVDYLAFYQPGSFGDWGSRIEFIAPVRGHELTSRRQLLHAEPDHPRADDDYIKMQLAGLRKLPQPILAETWKRLAFLYTTGGYLLSANTLNDLVLHGEEKKLLWRSMRERSLRAQEYQTAELPGPDLSDEALSGLIRIFAGFEGAARS